MFVFRLYFWALEFTLAVRRRKQKLIKNKIHKCNEKGRYLLYKQHIYKTLRNGIFNSYRNIFIIYKLEKCSV